MFWNKKENLKSSGKELFINPTIPSEQHMNRVIERIKRLKYSINKATDKNTDHYHELKFELTRMELALTEYEFKNGRK